MNAEYIRTLIGYNAWAHKRVWECISQLNDEEFTREVGYSLGSIRNQVVHVMSVDQRRLGRIEGGELPAHLLNEDYPTIESAKFTFDEVEKRFANYVAQVSDTAIDRIVNYHMAHRGGDKSNTVWQILIHVVNHGTDHRAQILSMLHGMGKPTVEQDIMFYLWLQS